VARGAASKRIWITELGNNTRGDDAATEAEQAAYLTRYVEMAKSYGYVEGLLYYTYRDFCTDSGDKECWFGILRPDGSRKPAFDALRQAAQANP
jgi:polysaccharide biosynthesis protein PslG